jgi:hypothetical protein
MSEEDKSIGTAKAAWRSQHVQEPLLSFEYLQNRVFEHRKQRRDRTVLEYLLGLVAGAMCIWLTVVIDDVLFRVGALAMLAGVVYSLYKWWRRKAMWSITLEDSVADGLTSYRKELARLRDLHRDIWKTYLPAAVPGGVLLLVWLFLDRPEVSVGGKIILATAVALWISVALWQETREADRYQRELDALEDKT